MENEKKHKLFFNVFNKIRAKKEAEKQAAETPAVEEAAQEKPCQCSCHCAREVKTYEIEYRACRGALEQIYDLGELPKTEDKQADELNCRARMEIMKSVADVILEMMEDMEGG